MLACLSLFLVCFAWSLPLSLCISLSPSVFSPSLYQSLSLTLSFTLFPLSPTHSPSIFLHLYLALFLFLFICSTFFNWQTYDGPRSVLLTTVPFSLSAVLSFNSPDDYAITSANSKRNSYNLQSNSSSSNNIFSNYNSNSNSRRNSGSNITKQVRSPYLSCNVLNVLCNYDIYSEEYYYHHHHHEHHHHHHHNCIKHSRRYKTNKETWPVW